jgi:2-oxoglutarate dehydrogenase E1 component
MARQEKNRHFASTSFLHGASAGYIEELHNLFLENPDAVGNEWQRFFKDMDDGALPAVSDDDLPSTVSVGNGQGGSAASDCEPCSDEEIYRNRRHTVRALWLIRAYRVRGHLAANLDPLNLNRNEDHPDLQIESYGFGEEDLDREIFLDGVLGLRTATLRQILQILKKTYCSSIGIEYTHISVPAQKIWLQERVEGIDKEITYTRKGKLAILRKVLEAESFERFLDVKYTGTKRFGLDGGEALVPAVEQIIKRGGSLGVENIVIGMPHRGRLNMLANIMDKPLRAILHEFKGGSSNPDSVSGSGDVKYHLGTSSDREFDNNKVHLSLSANPSHLEAVDPVVLGKARAKQDLRGDKNRDRVLPLLLHGDAAFAGQGVVAECFGMSALQGHRTGGSIHFIVNNQIGFTTMPKFARSSPYPSSVAKMVEAPIFHVNGDDPEAVVHVAKVAAEYRQLFHKPVVIDMFCYRRHGHNEADEPFFTQPMMYKAIRNHPMVGEFYAKKLIEEGVITPDDVEEMKAEITNHQEAEMVAAENYRPNKADWFGGRWNRIGLAEHGPRRGNTGVDDDQIRRVGNSITSFPPSLRAHKTIQRLFTRRKNMIDTGKGIDWATAEALAFGTLVSDGYTVRLSGQDCERGTFSQRHAVVVDQENGEKYTPLCNMENVKGRFEVINSMLSEYAVLGFEYGYSLSDPYALVMWEAQFGDFANGAQVIVDQFISSAQHKWLRMSGLVMLLPHGYEGQGPEHSSARLERYLQLCAEDNIQVANCTTPSNYFHILRRQMCRNFRKPLIIMAPKSMLRHKMVVSDLEEFLPGTTFHRVLWDVADNLKPDEQIRRVILCSGKVYYDLYAEREKRGIDDVYIMRIEQLYPFPAQVLIEELTRFVHAEVVWCQEEHKNMGAWTFIEPNIEFVLEHINATHTRPRYIGRPAAASTAAGLMRRHLRELNDFLDEAFS